MRFRRSTSVLIVTAVVLTTTAPTLVEAAFVGRGSTFGCTAPQRHHPHQEWKDLLRRSKTTSLNIRPEDFAAGKIGIPLPFRGFPMPELTYEEELEDNEEAGEQIRGEQVSPPVEEPETPKVVVVPSTPPPAPKPAPEPEPAPAPVPPQPAPTPPAPAPTPPPPAPTPPAPKPSLPEPSPKPPVVKPSPPPPAKSTAVAAPTSSNNDNALSDLASKVPLPLLVIPFAALIAGRAVLSNREQKKKEIEAEINAAETRKKKELSTSNSLVFTLVVAAGVSLAAVFFSYFGSISDNSPSTPYTASSSTAASVVVPPAPPVVEPKAELGSTATSVFDNLLQRLQEPPTVTTPEELVEESSIATKEAATPEVSPTAAVSTGTTPTSLLDNLLQRIQESPNDASAVVDDPSATTTTTTEEKATSEVTAAATSGVAVVETETAPATKGATAATLVSKATDIDNAVMDESK